MSGQFANKQFAGDQFAGKQFGANEGDSGVVWLSANLSGAGAIVGVITGVEESTRGSRRHSRLKRIREGYAFANAVATRGHVSELRAKVGRARVEPVAFALGVGGVGVAAPGLASGVVSVAGFAKTSLPRAVRSRVEEPRLSGGGSAAALCVVGVAQVAVVSAAGSGAAMPGVEVVGTLVQPARGHGIRNPSDEEFVAMVMAVRRHRLTLRSAGRILRRS